MYGLPEGYRANPICRMDHEERDASLWQVGVYRFVQQLMERFGLTSLLDIGCGVPEKLEKYILPVTSNITGLDLPHTIEAIRDRYSFGQWETFDLDGPIRRLEAQFDIILASDVIEHLENPDNLLDFIKVQSNDQTFIILSTPDRDTLGVSMLGPPVNLYHVREWNKVEFVSYLESRGFSVIKSFLAQEPADYKCNICVCNYSDN